MTRACYRAYEFRAEPGDGRTLEGYAAVFNAPSRIRSWEGEFDEVIEPGAFTRSLGARKPVLLFDHGHDTRVGSVPIGAFQELRQDDRGLFVRARLFDNPVVEPVRQAIAGQAIDGMSFRFSVPAGKDRWTKRTGDVDLRQLGDVDLFELGPVVFPAYDSTSVMVRSLLADLSPDERRALTRELLAELRSTPVLTGRPAQGAGGGDSDERPRSGDASTFLTQFRADQEALRLRGILK